MYSKTRVEDKISLTEKSNINILYVIAELMIGKKNKS